MDITEKQFYRDLHIVVSDQFINDTLVKFAQLEYTKCLDTILNSSDIYLIARAQGKADILQKIMKLKEYTASILKNSK